MICNKWNATQIKCLNDAFISDFVGSIFNFYYYFFCVWERETTRVSLSAFISSQGLFSYCKAVITFKVLIYCSGTHDVIYYLESFYTCKFNWIKIFETFFDEWNIISLKPWGSWKHFLPTTFLNIQMCFCLLNSF